MIESVGLGVTVLYKEVWKNIPEKMIFEQRFEGVEGLSQADLCGKNISGKSLRSKGPGGAVCLNYSRKCKETRIVGSV